MDCNTHTTKGSTLLVALFVSFVVLGIVIEVSNMAIDGLRQGRRAQNTLQAYYAAMSGVERAIALREAKQGPVTIGIRDGVGAVFTETDTAGPLVFNVEQDSTLSVELFNEDMRAGDGAPATVRLVWDEPASCGGASMLAVQSTAVVGILAPGGALEDFDREQLFFSGQPGLFAVDTRVRPIIRIKPLYCSVKNLTLTLITDGGEPLAIGGWKRVLSQGWAPGSRVQVEALFPLRRGIAPQFTSVLYSASPLVK